MEAENDNNYLIKAINFLIENGSDINIIYDGDTILNVLIKDTNVNFTIDFPDNCYMAS